MIYKSIPKTLDLVYSCYRLQSYWDTIAGGLSKIHQWLSSQPPSIKKHSHSVEVFVSIINCLALLLSLFWKLISIPQNYSLPRWCRTFCSWVTPMGTSSLINGENRKMGGGEAWTHKGYKNLYKGYVVWTHAFPSNNHKSPEMEEWGKSHLFWWKEGSICSWFVSCLFIQ